MAPPSPTVSGPRGRIICSPRQGGGGAAFRRQSNRVLYARTGGPVLLAHDVKLTGDGGGKVPALARSPRGRSRVSGVIANGIRRVSELPGVSWQSVEVNGSVGAIFLDGHQRLIGVIALDITEGLITSISSILNPDKLTHLGPVADLGKLLKQE